MFKDMVQARHTLTVTEVDGQLLIQVRRRPGVLSCRVIFADLSSHFDTENLRPRDLRRQAIAVPKLIDAAAVQQTLNALRIVGWIVLSEPARPNASQLPSTSLDKSVLRSCLANVPPTPRPRTKGPEH